MTRLLYVFRGEHARTPPGQVADLRAAGFDVDIMPVSAGARGKGVPDILKSRRRLATYDVIVANEYWLVWGLAVALPAFARTRLIALGFNQSARLIRFGKPAIDSLLNRVWRRVARFIVHSREEARLFADIHQIPAERFSFVHWGYDLPGFDPATTSLPDRSYVSMIGRNNRDVELFYDAVEQAGVAGVVVTSAYVANALRKPPPPQVTLKVDLSMEDCLNYVAGSFAHLVLVMDGERGAGHISAVSAMLLGKPQIFSDVATLADYLVDGVNGLAVPIRDAAATAAAIARLRDEPELADRLATAGRRMAIEDMSHRAASEGVVKVIAQVMGGTAG